MREDVAEYRFRHSHFGISSSLPEPICRSICEDTPEEHPTLVGDQKEVFPMVVVASWMFRVSDSESLAFVCDDTSREWLFWISFKEIAEFPHKPSKMRSSGAEEDRSRPLLLPGAL
jgi:hypothetical protein